MSKSMPALIADTTVHDFVPAHGGAPWRIFLRVPSGPVPEAGWPVLYMTDGNAVIGTAVDAMRAQAFYPTGTNVGWGVIVAIGYPSRAPMIRCAAHGISARRRARPIRPSTRARPKSGPVGQGNSLPSSRTS